MSPAIQELNFDANDNAMAGKISKSALQGLANQIRSNPGALKDLKFADGTTSKTAVKTQDLRLDVHRNTKNAKMATGIIQANSQAKDNTVKAFLKGKTGGHKGTHQVIGQKIPFQLGEEFDVEQLAGAVENTQ